MTMKYLNDTGENGSARYAAKGPNGATYSRLDASRRESA